MATWTANFRLGGGRSRFLRQVSHYLVRYATWIPPLIWFNAYVAQVTFIRGPSMYPFLNPQYHESLREDLCLVWKLYAQEGLRRGMVVTFRFVPPFFLSSLGCGWAC
jgi:inner membrane protease subunit 2